MDIEIPNELLTYLDQRQGIVRDEIMDVEVLGGGVSNRTVLVRRRKGKDWVLKQALEKLRVPDDWFSDPLRIHREAEGMRVLKPLMPSGAVVSLVFEDNEHHIIAMEAVEEPFVNWKTELLQGQINASIVRQFAECLACIHSRFNVSQYASDGMLRDQRFFESLRIEPYYARSAEHVPEVSKFIELLVSRTRKRTFTLVHGDYSPKNVLVREGRLVLLDHEVIHIGDPAFDLGFSLTHLLSKANHVRDHRVAFIEAAQSYWATYYQALDATEWKDTLESMAVAHTMGCMLARIVGRSPLEYLSEDARMCQKQWCIQSMLRPPVTVPTLIESFEKHLVTCQ